MTSLSAFKVVEGEVDLQVPNVGKLCKTWYRIVGNINGGKRPLIVLNGGPGMPHHYLLALTDLTSIHDIPIVFYDQLGTGLSTHLPEQNGNIGLWTEQLFLDELDNLLTHLGIQDYDIYGHSWGAMLGSRFASQQPAGLKHLVLASGLADMTHWIHALNLLLQECPQDIQDVVKKHEDEGTTDSEEYTAATEFFFARHLCRLDPTPEDMNAAFGYMLQDPTVYHTMLGPSEFCVTGPLKNWSILNDLHKIKVPTLLTNGRFDEAQESVVYPLFHRIQKVKWVTFAESSHMAHLEERKRCIQVVGDFLKDI